jgi:glycosyltransferase involved in cell wall biosynthesis
MTLTEAAACATPAVATAIPGHMDAVVDGRSGLLAGDPRELLGGLDAVLSNPVLRQRLAAGASAVASRLSWEATARGTLAALAAEAVAARGRTTGPAADRGRGSASPRSATG